MMIRVMLIGAVLLLALLALRSTPSTRGLAVRRLALLIFTAAWIGAVLSPDSLQLMANWVGVARGTDLLLYTLVVAVSLAGIGIYKRFMVLEARLGDLARELAIATARRNDLESAVVLPSLLSLVDSSRDQPTERIS